MNMYFDASTAQNLDGSLFLAPITGVSGQHCKTFKRLPSRLAPPTILHRGATHIALESVHVLGHWLSLFTGLDYWTGLLD